MIIDRIRLAGSGAYFADASGDINLAASLPSIVRTEPAGEGRQIDAAAVEFYFEGVDLWPYFERQDHPLVSVTVMKEMLPGLFADPYRNRVYTIAGFNDFNAGTFVNCRALEVEGEPAIVALAPGPCQWTSARYRLPRPTNFEGAAWRLCPARMLPDAALNYTITLRGFDGSGNPLAPVPFVSQHFIGSNERSADLALDAVEQFELEFAAETKADGYFHEAHGQTGGFAPVGRPLLRGFHWLEPVECQHDFHSLSEMVAQAAGYDLLGARSADPLTRLALTLRLPATLVSGPNEDAPAGLYEYIAIEIDPDGALAAGELTFVSARLNAQDQLRPPEKAVP